VAPAISGAGGLNDGPGPGAAIRGAPILKTKNPGRRFETSTGASLPGEGDVSGTPGCH
jgi:hypothetical protein